MDKTAAAYIRVSDERQDEYSPDSQKKLIQDFAARKGYYIPSEYIYYDDGISAKSTKGRDAFNRMITAAESKEHPFDAIIVWKFSRFARNEEDSIMLKARLRRKGISVLSVSEPLPENDEYSSLIERFIEWDDAHYLKRLSQEVRRGMCEKFSRGEPVCPAGYGYIMKDKQYHIVEEEAEVVKTIFALFADGVGSRTIAASLNREGVRTRRGKEFDNRKIEYILNNPLYIGKLRYSVGGTNKHQHNYYGSDITVVDGRHERIISDETWEKCQKRIQSRKNAYGRYQRNEQTYDYMLKGLMRCGSCGATLVRNTTKEGEYYLQCHRYTKGSCKVSHSIMIEKANKAVEEELEKLSKTLAFTVEPANTAEAGRQAVDYDKVLQMEEKRMQRAKEAYQSGVDSLEEYSQNKAAIQKRIAEIKAEKAEKEKPCIIDKKDFAGRISQVLKAVRNKKVTEDAKAIALRSIIRDIVYYKEKGEFTVHFYI